jgi:hypothetical protein
LFTQKVWNLMFWPPNLAGQGRHFRVSKQCGAIGSSQVLGASPPSNSLVWETTQKRKMSTVGELIGGLKKLSVTNLFALTHF